MSERLRILICYDGSENSDAALQDLALAGLPDSVDALVVSVADVFLAPPIQNPEDIFPPHVPQSVRHALQRAERKLKEAEFLAIRASEAIKKNFPKWNVHYEAIANSPAWALIQKAHERNVDLIVLGAVGHSVLGGRLILGSVSQRVLYEATVSVRIARPTQKVGAAPIKLLVGVDNSSYSDAAVETVFRRNWPAGTQVRLLTVVDTVMAVPDPKDLTTLKWIEVENEESWDTVRQLFRPAVDKLCKRNLDAEIVIRKGEPKSALLDEAEAWDANCIFVGSKGIRGVERLLLGSVASAVSARATCTVEVVRPKQHITVA